MLLVPRQLQRVGMTGDVPYYGGRLSPAQAYAAAHPSRHRPPPAAAAARPPAPGAAARRIVPDEDAGRALAALQHLLDVGVISPEEYRLFQARVRG